METQTIELNSNLTGAVYCGPAIVLDVDRSSVRLQLPGREARAELALAYPYEPRPNDLVLALGVGDADVYVVGVLQGRGRTRLSVQGNLDIEASGQVTVRGGDGVRLEGKHVAVSAERYELLARSVIERLGDVHRWAKGVISTFAERTRTVVQENATLSAGRIVEKAKRDVVIDGEHVRLG